MLKSIPFFHFAQLLFDSQVLARQATVILKAILEAQSPRLSAIAQKMPGRPTTNASNGFSRPQTQKQFCCACFKPMRSLCWETRLKYRALKPDIRLM
jgi:hypothetical protein